MEKIDLKSMSNNEIDIQLKKYENEYESIKIKVTKLLDRMKELDLLFVEGKKELSNRNKGIL